MVKLQHRVTFTIMLALALPGLVNGQSLPSEAVIGLVLLLIAHALIFRVLLSKSTVFALETKSLPLIIVLGLSFFTTFIVGMLSSDPVINQASRSLLLVTGSSIALGLVVFLALSNRSTQASSIEILCTGVYQALFLICAAQIVLLILGINHSLAPLMPQTSSPNLFLQLLGFAVDRVMMPIGTGVQYPATLAATLVAMALVRILFLRDRRAVLTALVGMIVLALIDSRTAQFGPAVAVVAVLICRSSKLGAFIAASLLPLLMLFYLNVEEVFAGIFDAVVSGRYTAFGLFSGRETIWFYAMAQIRENSLFETLVGHGLYSHIKLGLRDQYSHLFSNTTIEGQRLATLHNSFLQLWLDGGVIGVIVLLSALWVAMGRVWRACLARPQMEPNRAYVAPAAVKFQHMAAIFSLFWVGASEVILLPYAREGFVLVLFVVVLPALLPIRPERITAARGSDVCRQFMQLNDADERRNEQPQHNEN